MRVKPDFSLSGTLTALLGITAFALLIVAATNPAKADDAHMEVISQSFENIDFMKEERAGQLEFMDLRFPNYLYGQYGPDHSESSLRLGWYPIPFFPYPVVA